MEENVIASWKYKKGALDAKREDMLQRYNQVLQ